MGKVKCTFKEWTLAINQELRIHQEKWRVQSIVKCPTVSCSTSSTDDNYDDAGDDGDDEHSNAL